MITDIYLMIILWRMMIFATQKKERLIYVLQFVFEEWCKASYQLAQTEDEFIHYSGSKINYSEQPISKDEIHIIPSYFLSETKHKSFTPEVAINNAIPVLFPLKNNHNWHFDIFSAVFYMLSRYEEYHNKVKDKWGRFPAKSSLASKHNFLHLPIVDIWLTELLKAIQTKHPEFIYERKTTVSFTYDVDVAYAYNLAQRTAVLAGYLEDPFDTYEYIKKESINPIFFFLLSKRKTRYDHNINPSHPLMKELVKRVASWCSVGIHPSFYSSDKTKKIVAEKKILESHLGQPVYQSRQHYLKFSIPHTYRVLQYNSITEDYSMAFAETPGFRAGTCTPFYFFDIDRNETSGLKLYPACIMESTFRDDIVLPVQEALPHFIHYFNEVNKVGGHFISIWHNDTLAANNKQHFRWLHQQILQYIRNHIKE